jgi:hypothetical protein
MKTRFLVSWVLVGVVAVAVPAAADADELWPVFVTQKNDVKGKRPGVGTPWDKISKDGNDITVNPGASIWFACENLLVHTNKKTFTIKFEQVGGTEKLKDLLKPAENNAGQGFTDGTDKDTVQSTADKSNSEPGTDGSITLKYTFKPQPYWERIQLVAKKGFRARIKVTAGSHCAETNRPQDPDGMRKELRSTGGGFGAPGASIGNPRITEIVVFPKVNPVDREAPWTFDAPPRTGNWRGSFVDTDPNGDDRPLGGLRIVTDGEGLGVGDLYDMSFAMVDDADMRYDLFAYESKSGEYVDLILAAGQLGMLDHFDAYPPGEDVCGHADWEVWEGGGDICGQVSEDQSFTPPHSLRVSGREGPAGDDFVHLFDIVGGVWQFKSMVYVPVDASGQAWFAFLNQYPRNKNWSLQIGFDADRNRVYNYNRPTQRLPLVKGQWTEIIVRIDLDRDVAEAWYQGQPFITNWSWRDGVSGNGQPWIQAVDVYGGEPNYGGISSIYFDDIEMTMVTFGSCCMGQTGECRDGISNLECAQVQGLFREETACAEWDPPCGDAMPCVRDPEWVCMGDVDGNGTVNPVDVGLIQAAFCSQGQCPEQALCQYDIDCNDVINPVDAGIVQSLFGQCAPPNDPCR